MVEILFQLPPLFRSFSPIEKCWQISKQTVGKKAYWDDETTIGAIKEGWAKLTQKKINDWILNMPQRLDEVGDRKGTMTGWSFLFCSLNILLEKQYSGGGGRRAKFYGRSLLDENLILKNHLSCDCHSLRTS